MYQPHKTGEEVGVDKKGESIVNCYTYVQNGDLNLCIFKEMTEEWLEFVVNCRRDREHRFDIVEGPMADDRSGIM